MTQDSKRTAIIIGGGVIGVTSAYALARDGWQVSILDTHDRPARGTSLGNGRQLSYGYASALGSPTLLRKLPSLLLGAGDAIRISARGREGYHRWLLRFAAQCSAGAYRRNTLELLELAEQSRQAMEALLDHVHIDFDHRRANKLVILPDKEAREASRPMLEAKRALGLEQRLVSSDEACEIEPALRQSARPFAGAIYMVGDDTGDCGKFSRALLDHLIREYGTEFRGKAPVARVASSGVRARVTLGSGEEIDADLAVIATGAAARELTTPLGHALPVQPMKGYSFTAPLGNAAPLVAISDIPRRLVFTHCGDKMLVAGIAEMGRVDTDVDAQRLSAMIDAARSVLPEAADYSRVSAGWAGLRPMTPNSQPITRMIEPGIAVNTGHGMLGWTLAMGSAQRLAQAVREAF